MQPHAQDVAAYFATLGAMLKRVGVTDADGKHRTVAAAFDWSIGLMRATHDAGNKLMFIGNGGSAAIASHMAIDYTKNGNLRSLAFNDGAALTCLGNDLGYESVFAKQIEMHARSGDLLLAISSSGRSQNILNGVAAACERNCRVVTLSGFAADNPLRVLGDLNFYIPSSEYGFVELTHLALCHALLDFAMGWTSDQTLLATEVAA